MADHSDTAPGDPGVLHTGSDGSVPDTGGRHGWVWMRDETGGHFDVRSDRVPMWRRKGATVVPDYPMHFGQAARAPKTTVTRPGRSIGAPGGLVAVDGGLGLPTPNPGPPAAPPPPDTDEPPTGGPDQHDTTAEQPDEPVESAGDVAEKTPTRKARIR